MTLPKIVYNIFIIIAIAAGLFVAVSMLPIKGNYKIFVVLSGSMEPTIRTGSIVTVMPEKDYIAGDVITFGEFGKTKSPITHRILEVKDTNGAISYVTKGDANNAPDTQLASKNDVVGKVLFSVPYAGYAINSAKKPLGFLLIIIVPALVIIFDELKNIRDELKKNKKTKNIEGNISENSNSSN